MQSGKKKKKKLSRREHSQEIISSAMAAVDGLTSNQSILPALRMFNWQETMRTLSKLSVASCLLLTQQPVGQNVVYVSLCLTSTICMTSVMISCFPSIHSSHEVSFLHSQPPKVPVGPNNISQDKYIVLINTASVKN